MAILYDDSQTQKCDFYPIPITSNQVLVHKCPKTAPNLDIYEVKLGCRGNWIKVTFLGSGIIIHYIALCLVSSMHSVAYLWIVQNLRDWGGGIGAALTLLCLPRPSVRRSLRGMGRKQAKLKNTIDISSARVKPH